MKHTTQKQRDILLNFFYIPEIDVPKDRQTASSLISRLFEIERCGRVKGFDANSRSDNYGDSD